MTQRIGPDDFPRPRRTDRSARAIAPVRQVHLGLGAFFRAHQAWYTEQAPDRDEWGIAAFTGRSAQLAERLTEQECLYTLVVRHAQADQFTVVSSVSRAHAAADRAAWLELLGTPHTSIVSLTVTEAAYHRDRSGHLDRADPAVQADLAAWRNGGTDELSTVPARLAAGFAARRVADAGPITLLSCDNLPGNGTAALRGVVEFAELVDGALADWLLAHVSAVDTLVDRITPATTERDVAEVRDRTHRDDRAVVVTEPYTEWIMSDTFAAARPDWPGAGAVITADVLPYEQRKLWLLNGAHSLLAYAAPSRGHRTVAAAMSDPTVARWVNEWWDEAAGHLTLPTEQTAAYRTALLSRFGNPRIAHQLAQIAADGSQKLPVRILPVLRAERAAGRLPTGATRVLGGWVVHLRGPAGAGGDPGVASAIAKIRSARPADAARLALEVLDPALADDGALVEAVAADALELGGNTVAP